VGVRTLGIDLSANPAKTGACLIDWDAGTVTPMDRPATDTQLVEAIAAADMTGIDIPLGWPDAFVDAISAHHRGDPWRPSATQPPADREPLRFRVTDLATRSRGAQPLSVSTDRIGVAAMRGARLQNLLREAGVDIDRSGTTGKLAEVYPAAALRAWGLTHSGYKGRPNASVCEDLAGDLARACGPLGNAVDESLVGCDDDALDAVVCGIVARAVLRGQSTAPPAHHLEMARREGWIHVPVVALDAILA
jgi:predicted nuclease with RNAse H fold